MKLLIVVDYQNDFVNGSLGFKKAEELGAYPQFNIIRTKNSSKNQRIR